MQLTDMSFSNASPVEGYGPGFFRIAGELLQGDLLVLPDRRQNWGGYEDLEPILACAEEIDVLLVGTGPQIEHLPPATRSTLEAAGLGVETMSSPQACRTFNVLLGEGRRVALAVLALDATP